MQLEGRQIGRYHFERFVGRGGTGEVFLAVDPRIQQQVAIKVMQVEDSPFSNADPSKQVARFRGEASAIAVLNHPRIVRLNDYDEADVDGTKLVYIVTPFYKQGSLEAWLRQRNLSFLSLQDTAHFVRQAAEALQYAHNRQIIHQDVKPSNFLIESEENTSRPNLLLTDFGISKSSNTTAYTGASGSLGTLTYMAPEQINGAPTYASDQYALAAMTYELLAGRPPFQGPPQFVIRQHFETLPQPPSSLNPDIPKSIDNVILRALSKRPEDRFDSVTAFANAFQQALQKSDAFPVPPPPPPGSAAAPATPQPRGPLSPIPQRGQRNRAFPQAPQRGNDVHTTLYISQMEAQRGTIRTMPLSGGRQATVTVPANAYNGQIIRLDGQGEPSRYGGPAGDLIVTVALVQDVPPLTPPPPPPASLRASRKLNKKVLASGIAVIVLLLAVVFYAVSHFGSTAHNPYPPNTGTLVLDDPLHDNSKGYKWDDASFSGNGSCGFTDGAYHITAQKGTSTFCNPEASNLSFNNLAFEVKITLVQGDNAGVIFRLNQPAGNFYYFGIRTDGTYVLVTLNNNKVVNVLRRGSKAFINRGLNQSNLVAVVATGTSIKLYVNNQFVDGTSDSSFSQGQIGIFANNDTGPSDVIASDARVWAL